MKEELEITHRITFSDNNNYVVAVFTNNEFSDLRTHCHGQAIDLAVMGFESLMFYKDVLNRLKILVEDVYGKNKESI